MFDHDKFQRDLKLLDPAKLAEARLLLNLYLAKCAPMIAKTYFTTLTKLSDFQLEDGQGNQDRTSAVAAATKQTFDLDNVEFIYLTLGETWHALIQQVTTDKLERLKTANQDLWDKILVRAQGH